MIGSDGGYCLDGVVFVSEHLLVHEKALTWVVQEVIDAGYTCEHTWFVDVFRLSSLVDLDGLLGLVETDSHFGQLYLRDYHLLIL